MDLEFKCLCHISQQCEASEKIKFHKINSEPMREEIICIRNHVAWLTDDLSCVSLVYVFCSSTAAHFQAFLRNMNLWDFCRPLCHLLLVTVGFLNELATGPFTVVFCFIFFGIRNSLLSNRKWKSLCPEWLLTTL